MSGCPGEGQLRSMSRKGAWFLSQSMQAERGVLCLEELWEIGKLEMKMRHLAAGKSKEITTLYRHTNTHLQTQETLELISWFSIRWL